MFDLNNEAYCDRCGKKLGKQNLFGERTFRLFLSWSDSFFPELGRDEDGFENYREIKPKTMQLCRTCELEFSNRYLPDVILKFLEKKEYPIKLKSTADDSKK